MIEMLNPVIVLAQVPPPEHGQSRMVENMLDSLQDAPFKGAIHHVDARFSLSMENIGESSLRKFFLALTYVFVCIRLRIRLNDPVLYYVPGPVKWSAVIRDWLLLLTLRPWFRKIVFHWHAIGQGEWAHGSERLRLSGPLWLDRLARCFSSLALHEPTTSITVSRNSDKDARAIGSQSIALVPNGISDPWPDFDSRIRNLRIERAKFLADDSTAQIRILFLSRGTFEKGLPDAIGAVRLLLDIPSIKGRPIHLTIAGGMDNETCDPITIALQKMKETHDGRFSYQLLDFVAGDTKMACYENADIFIAPSRWESFGLTVLEALASGLPIVAVASDGVSGIIPDDYPYLSKVGDIKSLANHTANVIAAFDRHDYGDFVDLLRTIYLDDFKQDYFSNNIINVFQGIISNGKHHTDQEEFFEEDRIAVGIYLADQNPRMGRSLGISRMTRSVMQSLSNNESITLNAIASRSSILPPNSEDCLLLPWSTGNSISRVLTDNLHMIAHIAVRSDILYYPKGFLPAFYLTSTPTIVTIHDTIVQHYADFYPSWRISFEYRYWSFLLKRTLLNANRILTVSEFSKNQIIAFMQRHGIPPKEITVTYEPCVYESIPQPVAPEKENKVIHLASAEPHKRTAQLIQWWLEAESERLDLPILEIIGNAPDGLIRKIEDSRTIRCLPFLPDSTLQAYYSSARALILPSEIEGFGLPALEAYYLGTPVCFVKDTSVEEILSRVTSKGAFSLESRESFYAALAEVMAMDSDEIHSCGLKLREQFESTKVTKRIEAVFQEVKNLSALLT